MTMTTTRITAPLADWFNARWTGTMGAIDGQDVAFIARMMDEVSPRTVVEIGCASGMSTCILASLMQHSGGGSLSSFDVASQYYVDPSKPVGFLLAEALPTPGVSVAVHPGKTCLDVGQHVAGPVDLCFIDAAHRHPWPLIDTLALLPLMRPGGIIIHHDLQMYRDTKGNDFATGPRHVLDQAPAHSRILAGTADQDIGKRLMKSRAITDNIFALRVPETKRAFGARLCEGFYLGWDKQEDRLIPLEFAARFAGFLASHYGPWVGQAFAEGLRRYAPPEEPMPLPQPVVPVAVPPARRGGLGRRVLRRISGR